MPIPIASKFFTRIDTKLKNVIWSGKKPRVTFSVLTTTKSAGSMEIPAIKDYYYVSLLDQMKFWFSPSEDKLLLNIEKEVTVGHDLSALSIASYVLLKISTSKLLCIRCTIIAWKRISKTKHKKDRTKVLIPTRVIDYCKMCYLVGSWIQQGHHIYKGLPIQYKNIIHSTFL